MKAPPATSDRSSLQPQSFDETVTEFVEAAEKSPMALGKRLDALLDEVTDGVANLDVDQASVVTARLEQLRRRTLDAVEKPWVPPLLQRVVDLQADVRDRRWKHWVHNARHVEATESDTVRGRVLRLLQGKYVGMRPSEIAEHLDVTRSQVSRALRQLRADGVVTSVRNVGTDGRAVLYTATENPRVTMVQQVMEVIDSLDATSDPTEMGVIARVGEEEVAFGQGEVIDEIIASGPPAKRLDWDRRGDRN